MVLKEVACYYSPVFDAAFNSNFIEGQTQTCSLKDTSEGVFSLLLQWIYGQKVHVRGLGWVRKLPAGVFVKFKSDSGLEARENVDAAGTNNVDDTVEAREPVMHDIDTQTKEAAYDLLFQLWVLADKLCMPHCKILSNRLFTKSASGGIEFRRLVPDTSMTTPAMTAHSECTWLINVLQIWR
jgi:hypothetical protein